MTTTELKQDIISVETRAWLDNPQKIKTALENQGAKLISSFTIEDEFYADLSNLSAKSHTFDQKQEAARIRKITNANDSMFVACVKSALEETPENLNLHDMTQITYYEEAPVEKAQKDRLVKKLAEKGFPTLLKKITKERTAYTLNNFTVTIDEIKGFSTAIEVRTSLSNPAEAPEVKMTEIEFLKALGIPQEDIIEKSYTHLILDAHIRSNPDLKLPHLKEELKRLKEKRKELLLRSEEHYREGGDGWHDNASWDILMERIKVLDAKISNLKMEIFELRRK
ncbi:CYTH domain-containing protein [candidate division WWE3 bacterium]|nr:CYTH domain-containing protein [candidate division WWE3 bacterium]